MGKKRKGKETEKRKGKEKVTRDVTRSLIPVGNTERYQTFHLVPVALTGTKY